MPNGSPLPRLLATNFAIGFIVSFALISAATAMGQSGRRVRKSAPAPVSAPEPTLSPANPAQKEKPALTFIVGMDRYNGFSNIPLYFYDSVLRSCAERLDDATAVKVEVAQGEMNRGQAVTRARAEKEDCVVWLQLKVDSMSADPGIVNNLNQLYLEYWVFAPTTAKLVTSGRTYQQGYRKGGVVVGPSGSGRSNTTYSEYLLKQAAREAAERILAHFQIHAPSDKVP